MKKKAGMSWVGQVVMYRQKPYITVAMKTDGAVVLMKEIKRWSSDRAGPLKINGGSFLLSRRIMSTVF